MPSNPSPFASTQVFSGTPVKLGHIIATTTKNNADTATPFSHTGDALKGKVLLLEASAACNVNFGTTNAVVAHVTATNADYGMNMAANERIVVRMDAERGYGWIAVVGAATVVVWELV